MSHGEMKTKIMTMFNLKEIPEFTPPAEPLTPIKKILRTPEECFSVVSKTAFPFEPRYVYSYSHAVVRIHYVDEGPADAKETILLMHGEPTWSFLYRNIIPPLVKAGYRVVAPDLVGFGKSDKPANRRDYSYERQVDWMSDFIVTANLDNVTMFAQDWGGLIGLRIAARFPERFLRICIGNTGLPVGGGVESGRQMSKTFRIWASVVSQKMPDWGIMMQMGVVRKQFSEEEKDAYRAPFPSEEYKAASRVYPQLVPQFDSHMGVEENKGAFKRVYSKWTKPFLTLFSDGDAVSRGGEKVWQTVCPGAKGQKHHILKGAGHFIQEDAPEEIVTHLLQFIQDNPMSLNPTPASFSSKL